MAILYITAMRIIKYPSGSIFDPQYLRTIAGEMYNIESGKLQYIDGRKLQSPHADYPVYTEGNVEYAMRMTAGTIIVPNHTDLEKFQAAIMKEITVLTAAADGGKHMNTIPHTVQPHQHTNLQLVSSLNITNEHGVPRRNIKRQFVFGLGIADEPDNRCRFHWVIMFADTASVQTYTTAKPALMLRDRVGSMYVDTGDLLKLAHNEIIFDYGLEIYRSYDDVKATNVPLTICQQPLMRVFGNDTKKTFNPRNLECKVFRVDYDQLPNIRKFNTGDDETDKQALDVCASCREILLDDNYVLVGKGGATDDGELMKEIPAEMLVRPAIPVCAYCMHNKSQRAWIEGQYNFVLRVKFPRSIETNIRETPNADLRSLYLAAHTEGVARVSHIDEAKSHVAIGKNWVGFGNINRFVTNHRHVGKKVAILSLV